jgi:hypothetical protein
MTIIEVLQFIDTSISLVLVGKIFSLLLIFGMIFGFYRLHKDPNNSINVIDLFADPNGKVGGSKMRLNLAFIISSWILVYYTLNGQLSEWLYTAFISAFVIDRISARTSDVVPPSTDQK